MASHEGSSISQSPDKGSSPCMQMILPLLSVIGHGIGGLKMIGRVRPHTKVASEMHSLYLEFRVQPWSFVMHVIACAVLGVEQNWMCVHPAFSATVGSEEVGGSEASSAHAPMRKAGMTANTSC
jgi:hypothetical protein